jgi:hypothetical protein
MGGIAAHVGRKPARNWGLFLMLGLCVGFWIVVTTVVAENL